MFLSSAALVGVIRVCGVLLPWFSVLIAPNLSGLLCQFCFRALVSAMADLALGDDFRSANFVL